MAAGQQLLSNELAAAAVATYSQSIMSKGLGWAEKVHMYVLVCKSIITFVFYLAQVLFWRGYELRGEEIDVDLCALPAQQLDDSLQQ